jgi:uncharacterized membrane protein HdeD (DUF308 family)
MIQDPTTISLCTYLWVFGMSLFGGIAGYLKKVQRGVAKRFSFIELILESIIGMFVGFTTFFMCNTQNLDTNTTLTLVLITSHMGSKAIYIFEFFLKKWLEKFGLSEVKK